MSTVSKSKYHYAQFCVRSEQNFDLLNENRKCFFRSNSKKISHTKIYPWKPYDKIWNQAPKTINRKNQNSDVSKPSFASALSPKNQFRTKICSKMAPIAQFQAWKYYIAELNTVFQFNVLNNAFGKSVACVCHLGWNLKTIEMFWMKWNEIKIK